MINTTPLTNFAQTLKAAELSRQQDVKITIQQARLLNIALVEILDKLNRDYESLLNEFKSNTAASVDTISVEMDGGGFDSK
jgi:translation initiation factor 1 (eIF-1/SUI1)